MPDFVQVPADGAGKKVTSKVYNDGSNDHYTQVVHIGDRTDPTVAASVTPEGAVRTEFSTGAPVFDAFSRMAVAHDNLLSAYKFYEGPKVITGRIGEEVTGTGTVAYDTSNLSYRCRVPSGAGNKARIASHRHFSYKPGSGFTTYFVVSTNNASQANTTMRAGLFNDNDGIFLEVENGVVYAVIRDSLSGLEDRVAQAAWNGDRLDGSGGDFNRSAATLDLTKLNIFAVSYQYLSAGAVNFYTYVDGTLTLIHKFGHYSGLTAPYMATTYLPHAFEIETTGTGQVGDTDLYTFCSASVGQGYDDLIRTPIAWDSNVSLTDGTETVLKAFQPSQTYMGEDNRYRFLIQYLSAISTSAPVVVTLYIKCVVSGDTWGESVMGLEMDSGATLVGGHAAYKAVFAPGQSGIAGADQFGADTSTDGMYRDADITASDVWVLTARSLDGTASDVYVSGTMIQVE